MKEYRRVPLRNFNHRRFHYDYKEIEKLIIDIKNILPEIKEIDKKEFTKELLDNQPSIGLTPNIDEAYKIILQNKKIDKDSLKQLFEIISLGVIGEIDETEYHYRTSKEFMMKKTDICSITDIGANSEDIEMYMDKLFEYINEGENRIIDNFIKSQIIHLYFVYIHPYSNINGRTSRTLSLWYLINNQNYPFTIFDRVTSLTYTDYSKNIRSIYKNGNITPYIKYILEEIQKELERIIIIIDIDKQKNLSKEEMLLIENYLFLNNPNIKSLIRLFMLNTRYYDTKIIEDYIKSLIEDDILIEKDEKLNLNIDNISRQDKIKRLKLERYIK